MDIVLLLMVDHQEDNNFNYMNTLFRLIALNLLVSFLFSCNKENEINPETTEKLFNFKGFEITQFKLYVGSLNGGKDISSTISDPLQLFKGEFTKENKIELYKFNALKIHKDTIIELPNRYDANTFNYKVTTNDSLFRWNIYANLWEWYGFKRNDKKIEYLKSFYKIVKKRENLDIFRSGVENGQLLYENFFENPNYFNGIQNMTSITDTVLFCNVKYIYGPS